MPSIAIRRYFVLPALFGAAVYGCADQQPTLSMRAAPPALAASAAAQTDIEALSRAVALAMQDVGLRQRVKNDLRESRHTVSHKLEFSRYVRGESGGILLAKMAQRTGHSRAALLEMLARVPALEFYMPVDEHRARWAGGADLLVGGALTEEAPPVAFTLTGTRVTLDREREPATPTLILVPVETDFQETIDTKRYRNTDDQGGQTIGTYETTCDESTALLSCDTSGGGGGGGGGGGTGTTYTTTQQRDIGVEEFASHFLARDDHEPWWKDDAEFYLLFVGTTNVNGAPLTTRKNIPNIWTNSPGWKAVDPDVSLFMWDTDYGTRVRVVCREQDGGGTNFTLTVKGSTELLGATVEFTGTFKIDDGDDNCGEDYITPRLSTGQWTLIPNGTSPEYNGTSDLIWYGYGKKY